MSHLFVDVTFSRTVRAMFNTALPPSRWTSPGAYCGDTAYKAQVDRFLKRMDDPRLMERATEAEVFAKVFLEAATTRKPRRRYARGSMARPVMFLRKWFGDGVYEFMLRRAFR